MAKSVGNCKIRIAVDSSEFNAFARVMCLSHDCIHNGMRDMGNGAGVHCEQKNIRIGKGGKCKDYYVAPAKVLPV